MKVRMTRKLASRTHVRNDERKPRPVDKKIGDGSVRFETPRRGYASRGLYTRFYQDTVENIGHWLDSQPTG
jgi:hypothetical protein